MSWCVRRTYVMRILPLGRLPNKNSLYYALRCIALRSDFASLNVLYALMFLLKPFSLSRLSTTLLFVKVEMAYFYLLKR